MSHRDHTQSHHRGGKTGGRRVQRSRVRRYLAPVVRHGFTNFTQSESLEMKAWGFRRYGGSKTLELLDVPTPSVSGGDLLIQVQAAGVNPVDYKLRNGEFRFIFKSQMPFVLGHEGAGIVVDKGREVTDFACGDEVYFARPHSHPSGSWAEYAVVSEKLASRRPRTISVEEVAGK